MLGRILAGGKIGKVGMGDDESDKPSSGFGDTVVDILNDECSSGSPAHPFLESFSGVLSPLFTVCVPMILEMLKGNLVFLWFTGVDVWYGVDCCLHHTEHGAEKGPFMQSL